MSFSSLEGVIEGLDDAVGHARREAKPFDYAATIAGLRATDRYTLEIRLTRPDPTFIYNLAYGGLSGQRDRPSFPEGDIRLGSVSMERTCVARFRVLRLEQELAEWIGVLARERALALCATD
jgi:hypothetical protein